MNHETFVQRIYSVKPFKEVQSPITPKPKEYQTSQTEHEGSDHILVSSHQISNFQLSNLEEEKLDITASQIISNLTLNFDSLFDKISKVKQQFESQKALTDRYQGQCLNNQFIQFKKVSSAFDLNKDSLTLQGGLEDIAPSSNQHNSFNSYRPVNKYSNSEKNTNEDSVQNLETLSKPVKFSHSLNFNTALKEELNLNEKVSKTTHEIDIIDQFDAEYNKFQCSLKIVRSSDYLLEKPEIFKIGDFELGKCLGSGKFGDVFVVRHKGTNTLYALKKIFKSTICEYKMEDQLAKQLRIHYGLNHPNIVKLYAHFDDEYHIFLLMEYAAGGMLMDHLNKGQSFVSSVLHQMLLAVDYLQKHNIVHRDIKPQNIVISQDGTMKLCDFGWAATYQNHMKTTFCGTLDYVSPEMKDRGEYTMSVDIWSLGVLTFELLCGFAPYKNEITTWRLKGASRSSQWNWDIIYPSYLSCASESFMRSILKQNPDERATVRMCLNHLFIRKYQKQLMGLSSEVADQLLQNANTVLE